MQNPCKTLESAIPYCENDIILKLRDLAGGSSFTEEYYNFILEAQAHPNPIVKNYALQNNPLWFKVALAFELSYIDLEEDEEEELLEDWERERAEERLRCPR